MKLLRFKEHVRAVVPIYLFITGMITGLILIVVFNIRDNDPTDFFLIIFLYIAGLIFFYWGIYNDYRRKIKLLERSHIMEFFNEKNWTVDERFGWEHRLTISGHYEEFPIFISLHYNKGAFFREYYFYLSAAIKLMDHKLEKHQRKALRKELLKNNIDLYAEHVSYEKEIFINSSDLKGDLVQALNDLTQLLRSYNLSPLAQQ